MRNVDERCAAVRGRTRRLRRKREVGAAAVVAIGLFASPAAGAGIRQIPPAKSCR